MGRREDFARTMRHEKPENLIIDFGGNPLSSMEGGEREQAAGIFRVWEKRAGTCRLEKNTAPGRASFEVF